MSAEQTQGRLLDAAEALFAEQGLAGPSLRAITAAADVNLAAVNYHFQSKEGLIAAVFERRIGPLNCERLELLDKALATARSRPPELEMILRSFLAPALRLRASREPGAVYFIRLLGRVFCDPNEIKVQVLRQFQPTAERFVEAISLALPDLPRTELLWRLHFLIGCLSHTIAGGDLIRLLSAGVCDPDDVEGTLLRLTNYAAAGFRSPAVHHTVATHR